MSLEKLGGTSINSAVRRDDAGKVRRKKYWDSLDGPGVKNPPSNAGD